VEKDSRIADRSDTDAVTAGGTNDEDE